MTSQITLLQEWNDTIERIQGCTNFEKLVEIQRFTRNRIEYIEDPKQWDKREFWEPPETVLTTGKCDCDGKAILTFVGTQQANIDWPTAMALIDYLGKKHLVVFCGKYVVDSAADDIYMRHAAIPVYVTFNLKQLYARKANGETIVAGALEHLGELQRAYQASPMLKAIA